MSELSPPVRDALLAKLLGLRLVSEPYDPPETGRSVTRFETASEAIEFTERLLEEHRQDGTLPPYQRRQHTKKKRRYEAVSDSGDFEQDLAEAEEALDGYPEEILLLAY